MGLMGSGASGLVGGSKEDESASRSSHGSHAHTPGPWCVKRRFDVYEDTQKPGIGGTYIGTTRNREFVATTEGSGELAESVNRRCEADAHLIAAAPAMLEALRKVIAALDRSPTHGGYTARPIAAEAIKKATGEVV